MYFLSLGPSNHAYIYSWTWKNNSDTGALNFVCGLWDGDEHVAGFFRRALGSSTGGADGKQREKSRSDAIATEVSDNHWGAVPKLRWPFRVDLSCGKDLDPILPSKSIIRWRMPWKGALARQLTLAKASPDRVICGPLSYDQGIKSCHMMPGSQ